MKINFNVPVLDEEGNPSYEVATDRKNMKLDATGKLSAPYMRDPNDPTKPLMKEVTVKELLYKMLNNKSELEESGSFSEQAKRNKLARKIATSSTANYRTEELELIKKVSGLYASYELVGQLEDLIEGSGKEDDTAEGGQDTTAAA